MTTIYDRYDTERGCGWRKPGGLYLVCSGTAAACARLPLPCDRCPTCGHGIKPSRGWTWIDVAPLVAHADACTASHCDQCPLGRGMPERAGLLWIGSQFYAHPEDWRREGQTMGISRRLAAIPKGFVLGETWVVAAHRQAIMAVTDAGEIVYTPGIFQAFRPTAIEYVVKDTDTPARLAALEARGITLVRVIRINTAQQLFAEAEPAHTMRSASTGLIERAP